MCLWLTDGWCVDKMILLLKLNKLFQNLLWLAGKGILTDECRSSTSVVWALLLKWRTWILFPPMHLLKLRNCLKFEHEVHSLPTVTHIWASVTFLSSFGQKNVLLRMKVKIKSSFSHFESPPSSWKKTECNREINLITASWIHLISYQDTR